jgi:hypothetical protein
MARPSLSDLVTLKRAEEQVREAFQRRWCPCGGEIRKLSGEKLCVRCRMNARRRERRQREANRT